MVLIAGLGNPGITYRHNRHNLGFLVTDELICHFGAQKIHSKDSFEGELYRHKELLFLKPQTYMNNSGKSIFAVQKYYDIDTTFVIYDDLDLSFGTIRYKKGGGSGGHNGLKSCDMFFKDGYYKIRLGISRPPHKDFEVVDYVLGNLTDAQLKCIPELSSVVIKALEEFFKSSFEKMTSLYSIKTPLCKEVS